MLQGLCIIADDLTGALDAAAPFAGRGMAVKVWLDPQAFMQDVSAAWAGGLRLFAISTDSRDGSPAQAAQLLRQIADALPPQIRIFKKIDSRMKGHIGAELAALRPKRLLLAPAIPGFGRIVRGGHVTGFGVDQPIAIAPLLGALARIAVIPDTITAADMAQLVQDLPDDLPQDLLLVGAKGLADALACKLSGRDQAALIAPHAHCPLIAIGSRDPITLAQVAALRQAALAQAALAQAALGQAVRLDYRAAPNGRIIDPSPPQGLTLIQATTGPAPLPPEEVAAALATSLRPMMAQADLLFISGGATAQSVLASLGISHMTLQGECFAGVPVARAGSHMILTKSGGFGEVDVLVKLAALLAGNGAEVAP